MPTLPTTLISDKKKWSEVTGQRVIIIGGGAAGLSAAYALKKHGIRPILLEAHDRVGGRMGGDRVNGFCIDKGADFFCDSYDVAFRICEELGLSLIRSQMNLGWYRNGKWVVTTPIQSAGELLKNLPAFRNIGFLSPRAAWSLVKIAKAIKGQSEHLNFASNSRIAELDGEENFGDYLTRLGVPGSLRTTLEGFLEMTMGYVEYSGAAYMRTYLAEMLMKSDQIYVPKEGASALAYALADACRDVIRVSTPVKQVVIKNGAVTGVVVDNSTIEADAVICAVPPSKVPGIIPDLPASIRRTLNNVVYSSGCRVVIGLDRPPLPSGWNGALYPEDDTPLLLDRSVNLPDCTPPGKSMLDLLVGRGRAEELLLLDDNEIKRQMLRDARRNPPPGSNLPGDDEGLFARVYRWKEAVCMAHPGMFTAVADMRRQLDRDMKNLFLAGDYMRVPSVNGALASGVDAAGEVAELLASGPA